MDDSLTTALLIGVAVLFLAWPMIRSRLSPVPRLSPQEVKQRLDRGEPILVVDVRSRGELAQGRIPGAVNAPLPELRRHLDDLRARLPDDPQAGVVVVCHSSARAAAAVPTLAAAGFTKVAVLAGGMAAWGRAGLPIER